MDGSDTIPLREQTGYEGVLRKGGGGGGGGAQVAFDHASPLAVIAADLGPGPFALIALFISPDANFRALVGAAQTRFPGTRIIACSTAGEIGAAGYEEGQIVAIGFPASRFAARCVAIRDLTRVDSQALSDRVIRARLELAESAARFANSFAFLLIDGMSLREDQIAAALSPALGSVPLSAARPGTGRASSEHGSRWTPRPSTMAPLSH